MLKSKSRRRRTCANLFRFFGILYVAGCSYFLDFGPELCRPAKIGASSVWQLPEQFMAGAHAACDKSAPPAFAECVIDQMAKAGASADAVNFTRELYKQSHGDVGIMTGFQPVGPVDFAWITYPLRANTNYGLLLVNGNPPHRECRRPEACSTERRCSRVPSSRTCRFQFPQVDVWPGDRDGKTWPNSQTGPDGGVQFTVAIR